MVENISEIIKKISPYYKKKGGPESEHSLTYDSASESLEPIYFFILDLMNNFGLQTEKLVDSFVSSPGSSHFSELGTKATQMQQQASKILGDVNTVLRSILNLTYDLKDFKTRLAHYDGLKSKDKYLAEGSRLALKQIWMDKVDVTKGRGSINMLAQDLQFVTLRDAFMSVKDEKDVDRLDLNDRVKRILKPRISEFNIWIKESENELSKRYELEKNYLRSQVNSLKLYSRWAKPYLKAASELEQKEAGKSADLVKTFNTILLELTILGKQKIDLKSSALEGDLPEEFAKKRFLKNKKRDYYICLIVDFYFRGIPQRTGQQGGYSFGGKTDVSFKSYVLNDDELKKFEKELEKSDLGDVLKLIEGTTTESLDKMQDEINSFLEEKPESEKKKTSEVNPFLALFGKYEKKEIKKEKKEDKDTPVKKDSWIEKNIIRPFAAKKSEDANFALFDVYKKAHGMASYT